VQFILSFLRISRTVNYLIFFDRFLQFCFQLAYLNFAIPSTKDGPVFSHILQSKQDSDESDSSLERIPSRESSPFDIITLAELESTTKFESAIEDLRRKFGSPMTLEEAQDAIKLLSNEEFVFTYDIKRLTLNEVKSVNLKCNEGVIFGLVIILIFYCFPQHNFLLSVLRNKILNVKTFLSYWTFLMKWSVSIATTDLAV